jgi:hypothetical protein
MQAKDSYITRGELILKYFHHLQNSAYLIYPYLKAIRKKYAKVYIQTTHK